MHDLYIGDEALAWVIDGGITHWWNLKKLN